MSQRHSQGSRRDEPSGLDRLQKVLAAAGIGSRRECEALITGGRVEVDGQFVTELGRKVDPTAQKIQVDGVALAQPKRVYFALNKPAGVVSTNSDPDGRPRVIDLIKSDERLYPVGRLDRTSEGLILVTNDGELANRLTHPRYGIEKVYRVRVTGKPTPQELGKLRKGVYLSDGVAKVSSIQTKRCFKQSTELEIVLKEGRNREIRRILARIGHKVMQLKRVAIGPIRLGTMPVGAHRMLSRDEVQALRRATKRTRKDDTDSKPMAGERRGRASRQATPTVDESPVAKPRRRKTGSSAMSGYTRPSKKVVIRKRASADAPRGSQTSGYVSKSAQSSNSDARPGKKTAKKPAKNIVRSSKPGAGNKKTGRPGKGVGKPTSAIGKKKASRKRRR
jgi:23S rRNA pseudouridine2605 synthase